MGRTTPGRARNTTTSRARVRRASPLVLVVLGALVVIGGCARGPHRGDPARPTPRHPAVRAARTAPSTPSPPSPDAATDRPWAEVGATAADAATRIGTAATTAVGATDRIPAVTDPDDADRSTAGTAPGGR